MRTPHDRVVQVVVLADRLWRVLVEKVLQSNQLGSDGCLDALLDAHQSFLPAYTAIPKMSAMNAAAMNTGMNASISSCIIWRLQ